MRFWGRLGALILTFRPRFVPGRRLGAGIPGRRKGQSFPISSSAGRPPCWGCGISQMTGISSKRSRRSIFSFQNRKARPPGVKN